jgi:DNA-binding NtrC family response regulator
MLRRAAGHVWIIEEERSPEHSKAAGNCTKRDWLVTPCISREGSLAVSRADNSPGTILVVDDEEALLSLVCAVLGDEGYMCIAANSPNEAIQVCKRDDPFDLVISDFDMPIMNGLGLWRVLGELRPNLKVLFISGNLEACEMLAAEGFSCLEKPFSFAELLSGVRRFLEPREPRQRP